MTFYLRGDIILKKAGVNIDMNIKIATYNLAAGRYDDAFEGICADIIECNADVVGLQEVDKFVPRSGNVDMLEVIAQKCGYPYYHFVKAIDFCGGEYGTSVMSKFPITDAKVIPLLSRPENIESRSAGVFEIDSDGDKINFVNTHIAYENRDATAYHLEQIAEIIKPLGSFILTGDFNTNNFALMDRILPPHKKANNAENELFSFPACNEGIDNIIMSPDWSYAEPTLAKHGASDHCLLTAILTKN